MRCILFNKPFRVLCRFTDTEGRTTLARFINEQGLYPAGRLDYDSEGLVVLTDDGRFQSRISHPSFGLLKRYWVQVEGTPTPAAIQELSNGVQLNDGRTRLAQARVIEEPSGLWPRDPPIRFRAHIPTSWLELGLKEGRNRQVRRMTAAVGLPTLRLIRYAIGPWGLENLAPGEWRALRPEEYRAYVSTWESTGVRRRSVR